MLKRKQNMSHFRREEIWLNANLGKRISWMTETDKLLPHLTLPQWAVHPAWRRTDSGCSWVFHNWVSEQSYTHVNSGFSPKLWLSGKQAQESSSSKGSLTHSVSPLGDMRGWDLYTFPTKMWIKPRGTRKEALPNSGMLQGHKAPKHDLRQEMQSQFFFSRLRGIRQF